MNRIFLLSPAHAGGRRAALLLRPRASFALARQIQLGSASLGEVFSFCSGLYFRGKLAYAQRFGRAPKPLTTIQVITPSRGLVAADTLVGVEDLHEFARIPVDSSEPRFTEPLVRTVTALAGSRDTEFVFLGSVATGKYLDTLLPIFGPRLLFPADFIGRGDMSRGALLLRSVASDQELPYLPVQGTTLSRALHPRRKTPVPQSS